MDKPKIKLPFGTGVYETIAIVNQRPAFLKQHLDRLERGADWLGIPRARERVNQLIRNKLGACPKEPMAMRAEAPGHGIPAASLWPRNRDITGAPIRIFWPKVGKARGNEDIIKHSLRAPKTTARKEAQAAGAWDAFVVDQNGIAVETTVCNIFVWIDDKLVTPGDAQFPLPGIARAIVLEEAQKLNIPIEFRGITADDITKAREIFITNCIAGVLGVDSVLFHDGRIVELPENRDITNKLAAARSAREEEDLKTAPGPLEMEEI
ncbi:MAG: aminotransferase class IV [Planctomycetota bacterium]